MSTYDLAGKRIYVAGHRGMVGAAIIRRLEREAPAEIITMTRQELDLRDQRAVHDWMMAAKPDAIFMAAAKVGGIIANDSYPAEFLYDNLTLTNNIIHSAYQSGVEKLLCLGSSCVYPKLAPQPIKETALLEGALEPTNQWYAIAKIAGIKMCQAYRRQYGCDFISAMPTNLYGPGDNYHLENSHVIPGLMRKAHEAKMNQSPSMEIWGTGNIKREFMHVDDCADGLVFIMKNISQETHVNIGQGDDITIQDLAKLIMERVGYNGALTHNFSRPDGTPQKLMDNTILAAMGWSPSYDLTSGLDHSYQWFLDHKDNIREA